MLLHSISAFPLGGHYPSAPKVMSASLSRSETVEGRLHSWSSCSAQLEPKVHFHPQTFDSKVSAPLRPILPDCSPLPLARPVLLARAGSAALGTGTWETGFRVWFVSACLEAGARCQGPQTSGTPPLPPILPLGFPRPTLPLHPCCGPAGVMGAAGGISHNLFITSQPLGGQRPILPHLPALFLKATHLADSHVLLHVDRRARRSCPGWTPFPARRKFQGTPTPASLGLKWSSALELNHRAPPEPQALLTCVSPSLVLNSAQARWEGCHGQSPAHQQVPRQTGFCAFTRIPFGEYKSFSL